MRVDGTSLQAHTPIDGVVAAIVHHDRIQIELGELGEIERQCREAVQEVGEDAGREWRTTPEALDQPAERALREELSGVGVGQRSKRERDGADELRLHATEPDGDQRPERRILCRADEQLGASQHRLHEHGAADASSGLPDSLAVPEIQGHSAALGLVRSRDPPT